MKFASYCLEQAEDRFTRRNSSAGGAHCAVAELQPKPAAGVKKKQGAQSGAGSRVRALPAVQMLSAAVDVNGDGVIAWGEYYFAAKEIASVFVSAT
jgi:hypothetical protein